MLLIKVFTSIFDNTLKGKLSRLAVFNGDSILLLPETLIALLQHNRNHRDYALLGVGEASLVADDVV